ncbi:MAG: glycosyltransferase [Candidatus Kapaibacterium sp.]
MSISVMILTKNNSSSLTDTIDSVIDIADSIIVVDTGSEDDSPVIASKKGAEVFFFNWNDNFSDARNFALKHIHTEWVLVLDSDEILTKFDMDVFQSISSNPRVGGINLKIANNLSNDNNNSEIRTHRYTRLFRNCDKFRFEGRIHEQIKHSIEAAGFETVESDFCINHYGYSKKSISRYERNIRLLKSDLLDSPYDDYKKFHLAETYFVDGNYEEAELIYKKIQYSDELSTSQSEMVQLRLAQTALRNDDLERVEELTKSASNDEQNEALRLYVRGTAFLLRQNYPDALICFETCLRIASPSLSRKDLESALSLTKRISK